VHRLDTEWASFLVDFRHRWPTEDERIVVSIRSGKINAMAVYLSHWRDALSEEERTLIEGVAGSNAAVAVGGGRLVNSRSRTQTGHRGAAAPAAPTAGLIEEPCQNRFFVQHLDQSSTPFVLISNDQPRHRLANRGDLAA